MHLKPDKTRPRHRSLWSRRDVLRAGGAITLGSSLASCEGTLGFNGDSDSDGDGAFAATTNAEIQGSGRVGTPLVCRAPRYELAGQPVETETTFQWKLDGDEVSGATSSEWTPTELHAGRTPSCDVTSSYQGYSARQTAIGTRVFVVDLLEPPAPPENLTADGRVVLNFNANAATIAGYPENTGFWLPNGTYTNLIDVVPKNGMSFVGESTEGVVLRGGSGAVHAFKGNAEGVVLARMTVTNYSGAGPSQFAATIMGATSPEYSGSADAAKDWYLFELNLLNNGNTGVFVGHRFKVVGGRIEGQSPAGLAGDRMTGGLVHSVFFKNNGRSGAQGAAVNNAQIKMTWMNVGPLGQTDRDSSVWTSTRGNKLPPQAEPPATFQIVACTFDCAVEGATNTRAVWFDLDCRNTEVAHCTISDSSSFGVFNEGCNGSWIHHNTFIRCGDGGGLIGTDGSFPGKYYAGAAVSTGSSDNIVVEDNLFQDCPTCMIEFLAERGRNGADWALGGFYPVASATLNFMIRNEFVAIRPGERSTVGSSNNKWRRNTLTGSSARVGTVFGPGINTATEAHLDTSEWSDNIYAGSSQESSSEFYWNRQKMDLAAWAAAGRK